jgi:hypothetical protein
MGNTTYIVARHDQPLRSLPFFQGWEGESEETEFGGGWRLLEVKRVFQLAVVSRSIAGDTGAPALCALGSESGFLALRLSEKAKHESSLLVNGLAEARAAELIDAKYKMRPLVAMGACTSWAKKAKLKENYDALRTATTRDAVPGVHGEELLRTYLVGLGIPNCETIDPFWNDIGGIVTAQRKAKWMPHIQIDVFTEL